MSSSSQPPDRLPLRWGVILISALLVAFLVGALTFAQMASWPGTILAALTAGGATVPALHQLLGR